MKRKKSYEELEEEAQTLRERLEWLKKEEEVTLLRQQVKTKERNRGILGTLRKHYKEWADKPLEKKR